MNRSHFAFQAILVALTVLVGGACAGGDSGVKVDSAGIEIVNSTGSGRWTENDRPFFTEVVRLGGSSTDTLYEFGAISGVDILADGNILVLDQQVQTIGIFDSTGIFVRRIGRRGAGPGEIRQAIAVFGAQGDTILVVDVAAQQLHRISTTGESYGNTPLQLTDGIPMRWMEREDGSIVAQLRVMDMGALSEVFGGGGRAAGAPPVAPVDLLVVRNSAGVVADTLLTLPTGESFQMGGEHGMRMRLFSPEPMWTLGADDQVFFGMNDEYSVNEYNAAGELVRIIRRDVQRQPVTDGIKNSLREQLRQQIANAGMPAEALDQMLGMMEFADSLPAIGGILGGPKGTLWVQRAMNAADIEDADLTTGQMSFGAPNYDVYNSDGVLLGEITMRQNFTPLRWVGDKLLGVWVNDGGVPHLMVLRISGL